MNGNFKVKAIKNYERWITKGKIYEYKDGKCVFDNGFISEIYDTYKDLISRNVQYEKVFIELQYNKWIFNLEEYKNDNIAINCEAEVQAKDLIEMLKMNGINIGRLDYNTIFSHYGCDVCYDYNKNRNIIEYCDSEYYQERNFITYKFSDVDFSQVYTKESIKEVALHNNKQNDFDITKVKYITKEQLSIRGYKTGDILFDGNSMAIVYGNKVLYINTNCVETLNPKAFDYILPIELIESDLEIQRLLSGKLSGKISQSYLVEYFIKIEEPPKLKTVCSVKFTVNADCPKDFILEDDSEAIAVNDIVEANTGGKNYQYAKVVEINTLELSEHEIEIYRTCRNLSL